MRLECIEMMTRLRQARRGELSCLFRLHGWFESAHSTLLTGHEPTAREHQTAQQPRDTFRPFGIAAEPEEIVGRAARQLPGRALHLHSLAARTQPVSGLGEYEAREEVALGHPAAS
ncbi:MAG TPA: hypothetical protein VG273_12405 [Bryobacteraceae bacterium]|nr:hypothetical protein [Bryobacteraceae bacterium]